MTPSAPGPFGRRSVEGRARAQVIGAGHRAARGPDELELSVGSSGDLASLRVDMRKWLEPLVTAERSDEVLLATGEAVANALEHGEPPVLVVMRWSAGPELDVVVRDGGRWQVAAHSTSRGLGLPIMSVLMDSVTVETVDGTSVNLKRRFDCK